MGAVSETDPFPWGGIAVRTVQVAAVVFLTFTGIVATARAQERRDRAEAERFRWTDEARWDR